MNHEQIQRLFPNASRSLFEANAQIPDAKPTQQTRALVADDAREAPRTGCAHVRYTLRRVRFLDVDAKYASTKDTLDSLATAGLIRGDREGEITLEVNQQKVGSYKEEETIIEIIYPA